MNEKFVMPWEERPADCKEAMWRYSKNPVIGESRHRTLPDTFIE